MEETIQSNHMDVDKEEARPNLEVQNLPQERCIWRMPELPPFPKVCLTTTSLTLLLDGCGKSTWSQVGANGPRRIFYGQLPPLGVLWHPRHKTFPWPFYGLRPYPAVIGLLGQFPLDQPPGLHL
ncbi:hypothetical protein O181_115831 [Austropuccinia psidii MF-1]|uniref:Uncharacterized protein n=1 Tax=Austropuccinia psidii MF-1 TaxID=1389203 RepID=A0A9Q3K9J7_9BASI|nr:hypothetical protein [Austropuccinia psidii MF-1]